MARFFKELGERFNTFRSAFLASGQEMSEQNIMDQLERHERFEKRSTTHGALCAKVNNNGPEKHIKCFECDLIGHKAAHCPSKGKDTPKSKDHEKA